MMSRRSASPTLRVRRKRSTRRSWSERTARRGSVNGQSRRNIRTDNFVEYPFAWFGILCEAPPSSEELIYCNSDRGFALISQRDENIQRMYFQCPSDEDVDGWTEEMIWDELQARLDGPGWVPTQTRTHLRQDGAPLPQLRL